MVMTRVDFAASIMSGQFIYIVVETKYTTHHIERMFYKDRGKIKWIAETNRDAFKAMDEDDAEAHRSHIDGGDLFPRLYFLGTSFLMEFSEWCKARDLFITNIKKGEI